VPPLDLGLGVRAGRRRDEAGGEDSKGAFHVGSVSVKKLERARMVPGACDSVM
jgi:hypothetical protein